jgi:hypothetical protein
MPEQARIGNGPLRCVAPLSPPLSGLPSEDDLFKEIPSNKLQVRFQMRCSPGQLGSLVFENGR